MASDHQFNLSAAVNDGYHTLIHMIPQSPSGPLTGIGRLYCSTSAGTINLFYMDDTGASTQITPAMPISAAVNFNGISGASIRSSYNVSSVTRLSQGVYKVTFTTPMPDSNYVVQVAGMRNSSGSLADTCINGSSSYSTSVTPNFVVVAAFNNAGNPQDVLMYNVTVFTVT